MFEKIHDWLRERTFTSDLKRHLRNDSWLRQTYICVNLSLTNADYAEEDPIAKIIQTQMTEEFRLNISRTVGLKLLEISKSENKVTECRRWICDVMVEYAPLRALYTSSDDHISEVESGVRHKATEGLYNAFETYAPVVYSHYFQNQTYQANHQNDEELRHLSIAYSFFMQIGNIARIGLGDTGDWYRRYFNICVAHAEVILTADQDHIIETLFEEREALRRELLDEAK